jgi:ABC-type multidrug transport system fused ATPase/permease subunit
VAIYAGNTLLGAIRSRLLEGVGARFVFDLRNRLFDKLARLPLAYFNEARTGDLMSRVGSDVDAVQEVVIRGTDSVIANLLRLVGVAVIFCSLNLKLGLATLVPILLVGLFLRAFNLRIRGVYKRTRETLGEVNARLQDSLSGIRVIKGFAREEAEKARFRQVAQHYLDENLRAIQTRTLFFPFVRFIANFGNIITIGYGAYLIVLGQFTLGGLVAYRSYGRYFYGPIDDLTQINDMVQRAIAAGNRLFEVLDAPETVSDRPNAIDLPLPGRGEIVFDNVSFRYNESDPDAPPVLDDVTLRVLPGQTAALVGSSGAGKSTLFALAARFWDPTGGRVLLDGHDLRDLTQDSLRRQVVGVPQETFLFAATVAENIRYARPDATDEEVEQAARAANAHEFIARLPDGYNTLVGERGVKLSGGQRQRVSVARAFLAGGSVLLLDEATSAVEPESERIIQEAIERLMNGRTTLVATHRLSTIRNADVIFVIDDARLVEQGTHDELMARSNGLYARMVRQQQNTDGPITTPSCPAAKRLLCRPARSPPRTGDEPSPPFVEQTGWARLYSTPFCSPFKEHPSMNNAVSRSPRRRSSRSHAAAALLLAAALPGATLAGAQAPASSSSPTSPLPIRDVVLFSSGVAYLQREGEVTGDATVPLTFRTAQINDILKSMILLDERGRVQPAIYNARDPIGRTLGSFAVNVSENLSQADVLRRLRGARVAVETTNKGTITGQIVGVEEREERAGETTIRVPYLSLLADNGGLTTVRLDAEKSVRLLDERLNREFREALGLLATGLRRPAPPGHAALFGRRPPPRPRRLRFRGAAVENELPPGNGRHGSRRVAGAAGAPAAATAATAAAQPYLQGWALVENTTDEDWQNVRLSLVSGRPVSFIQDLYQPLYLPRPVVPPDVVASPFPQTHGGNLEAEAKVAEQNAPPPPTAAPGGPESSARRAPAAPGGLGGRGGFGGGGILADGASSVLGTDVDNSVLLRNSVARRRRDSRRANCSSTTFPRPSACRASRPR